MKEFKILDKLCNKYSELKNTIDMYVYNGNVQFFNEEEMEKIKKLTIDSNEKSNIESNRYIAENFSSLYKEGEIVFGILLLLKNFSNDNKLGFHYWIESEEKIVDPSLLLIIDKKVASEFGYFEIKRYVVNENNIKKR